MRKVVLVTVGKIKEKYFADAIAEYSKRMSRFCDFHIVELADAGDKDTAVKIESDAILKKLCGYVILLDIGGQQLTSEQLAATLDGAYTRGSGVVTMIIGGSHGVDDRVRSSANLRLSFGKVTFPHQLMRVMTCEQIYRAFNILEGTPYHK